VPSGLGQLPAVRRDIADQPVDIVHRDARAAGLRQHTHEDREGNRAKPVPNLQDVAYE
jgi:hypothetical protein